jgi:spore coat polysaccharide biosynthesis protein SpsF (cytidylyltransferase family)
VDKKNDLKFVREIYKRISKKNKFITIEDIEKIISKEPLLLEINNDVNTDNEHKKFLPMKEQKKRNV